MKRLNRNSIPFFILLIIHTGMMCYAFYKSKNRKRLFVLLLSNIGLAYLFEYMILNIFNAYEYKPKVFKIKKIDNVFGAILSQAIFVPFTAIFITSLQLGWKSKILFSFYFSLIENLFLKLKIYRHNWWRTIYSFFLFPIYFHLSDSWYKQLTKGHIFIQFLSLYFMTFVSGINLLFVLSVKRKFRFGRGNHHSWNEHFVFAPLYSFFLSFISTCILFKNNTWRSWLLMLFITTGLDNWLMKVRVIKSKLRPNFIDHSLHVFMIGLTLLYKKWINEQKNG